ncbi:2-amino-4-hydroxy-6-hydroxymethyldihydropteridine diphosphokinase [Halomonas sp. BLK-85]
MSNFSRAYIGLGSNLDQPVEQVRQAIDELNQLPLTHRVSTSPLYCSSPIGPQDQDDFINAVAAVDTQLSPLALLDQLQALEQRHRRQRERRWGPRTLDLDLLLFDQLDLDHPRLRLPHPEIHVRRFVLYPLKDIAPQLSLYGKPLSCWSSALPASDSVILLN